MSSVYENKKWHLYHLLDPRTLEIRYVGITYRDILVRMRSHYSSGNEKELSKKAYPSYVANWVGSLRKEGLRPLVTVVETGFGNIGFQREVEEIVKCRKAGCKLTNLANGGYGGKPLGSKLSADIRKKLSEKAKAVVRDRRWSESQRRKFRETVGSIPRSEAFKASLRKVWAARRPEIWNDGSNLKYLYHDCRLSAAKIATIIGASTPMVYKLLREFEIPRRSSVETLKITNQRKRESA